VVSESNEIRPKPDVFPGLASSVLIKRGYNLMFYFGLLVIPIAFESYFKSIEAYYSGTLLGLMTIGVGAGFVVAQRGVIKQRREVARGYTSRWAVADQHPEVFLITYDTHEVISRPYETRPPHKRQIGVLLPPPSKPSTVTTQPRDISDPDTRRRCVRARCPRYMAEVTTSKCDACGNPTQRIPG
jgi:hypothetical protein